MKESTKQYLEVFRKDNPELLNQAKEVHKAVVIMLDCYEKGGKVLVCGNGGSASDSEHIVGELMKGFLKKRPITEAERQTFHERDENTKDCQWITENLQRAIPAISLVSQSSLITAYTNDVEPKLVFAQQVFGYGKKEDVFIGLSTSGNSANVLYGAKAAKSLGMKSIVFTGAKDSGLSEIGTVVLRSNETETYRVQEEHIKLYHLLCALLENELFEG